MVTIPRWLDGLLGMSERRNMKTAGNLDYCERPVFAQAFDAELERCGADIADWSDAGMTRGLRVSPVSADDQFLRIASCHCGGLLVSLVYPAGDAPRADLAADYGERLARAVALAARATAVAS